MVSKGTPIEAARFVSPYAIRSRAEGLGWVLVETVNGKAAVYRSPGDAGRQLLVPLNPAFDDYGERVAEAIDALARFENRPTREVLRRLLLPPADVLSLTPEGAATDASFLQIGRAANLLLGVQEILTAVAASILHPRPCHEGRFPAQAEQLGEACLLVHSDSSGQAVQVACPLGAVVQNPDLAGREPPFARVVSLGLMQTLDRLAGAVDQGRIKELLQPTPPPLLSANLCEALAFLRPVDPETALTVSLSWYRGISLPTDQVFPRTVKLRRETFEVARVLSSLLCRSGGSQWAWYVGFVEALCGHRGLDNRIAGEIQVAITRGGDVLHCRLDLPPDEYALAAKAHMDNTPVYFRGMLRRSPGLHRFEQVGPFLLVQRPPLAQTS